MKKLLFVLALLLSSVPATAQFDSCLPGVCGGAPPTGCTQGTTFLARTSGLNATHTTAYTNLICGLVSDGIWTKLDVLHIYATQDTTTAQLNLVSVSFPATLHGAPTFTVDRGYQGTEGSATVYIDTGFNPFTATTPNYVNNSAHISSWQVTNGQGTASTGGANGQNSYPIPRFTDDLFYCRINNAAAGAGQTVASTDSRGHFIVNRSGLNTEEAYKSGSLTHSPNNVGTGVPNITYYALGWNAAGTPTGYGQQMAMISYGSSLTGTDATNFYNRLRTYMTAVGVP